MSIPALEIVKEFFIVNNFYISVMDNFLFVKNIKENSKELEEFIIEKEKVRYLKEGIIKVCAWHTLKFTPSVIKKFSSEIFDITDENFYKKAKNFFKKNEFKKILIIPGLPTTNHLRNESIRIIKEKGINHIILFYTVISGLVEKIDERKLYQSHTLEIMRILKFYKFLSKEEFEKYLFEKK